MNVVDIHLAHFAALPHHVEGLAPHHSGATGGQREFANLGRRVAGGVGHKRERVSEKRVAGQNRSGLVKRAVKRGPAAPQLVVVEGRQVVVNQRISVDVFHRQRGGPRRLHLLLTAHRGRRVQHQQRP